LTRQHPVYVLGVIGLRPTESIHGDTSVVDDEVNTIGMVTSQVIGECFHTGAVSHVKGVEFNLGGASIGFQRFGLFKLRVFFEISNSGFTAAFIASCKVWSW
jgi:hypothetical protein